MSPQSTTLPLLLETIKIEDGKISNLPYHQERFTRSRQTLYQCDNILELSSLIEPPKEGLWRCRLLYEKRVHSIEYLPYTPKTIHRLKIVPSQIDYAYKYANRDALDSLFHEHKDVDEIIIEKDGYLTDTTISNIAFFDGKRWFTPTSPLLKGTMRAKLLDEGFLSTRDIHKEDLQSYTQVALMNAMLGFKVLKDIQITDLEGNAYDY